MNTEDTNFDAWNPGIESKIPRRLCELITLFRKENSKMSYKEAALAAELCGLKPQELHSLSVRRLVIHELLIRVTADLTVPDGPKYEDLGIALRKMVKAILINHIDKKLDFISEKFELFCIKANTRILEIFDQEFANNFTYPNKKPKRLKLFSSLLKSRVTEASFDESKQIKILEDWSSISKSTTDFDNRCRFSLGRIITGIINVRGELISDRSLFLPLAGIVFKNTFGGSEISRLVNPIFKVAVIDEEFRRLPLQSLPIVMNTKGASASGKSTIRPQQRALSEKMGIPWKDFALISPDYWRKFLLDYNSLGADYKYGAMLTAFELEIIDKKLDLYMERKALAGEMPHLLIDRFRFDSFIVGGDGNYTSRLLTRFGQKVFLFFIITSPIETVERAWKRGLKTSRYKAVDDLLYHNIEAFTGMPELFFSWMAIADKEVNFEFLDNNVVLGELPLTIAFGKIGKMVILDLSALNNIDVFREINVDAKKPNEVFLKNEVKYNYDFLKECLSRISKVIFLNGATAEIYGIYQDGKWLYKNRLHTPKTKSEIDCLRNIGWYDNFDTDNISDLEYYPNLDQELTLGRKT